jgi:hypothetical protein
MKNNRYLEKIASSGLRKVINFAEDVAGFKAKRLKDEASILTEAAITKRTPKAALDEASQASKRMVEARVKAGIGAAGVLGAGFLGVHKYHQHKDDVLMKKIDSMYKGN